MVLSGALTPAVDVSTLTGPERDDLRARNLKSSISAVCAAYLLYSTLQGPDTHMSRPHPALEGHARAFVLYMLFLVFLLCQETG